MKKVIFTVATLALIGLSNKASAQVCFVTHTDYSVSTTPYGLCSADFNGDGNLDLAATNYITGSNNVTIRLGNGTGSFGAATNFTVGSQPSGISSADFDGDGNADLAVATGTLTGNVSVLLGNGLGGFGAATNFAVGTNPWGVCSADFNMDGRIDLAVTNQTSNNVSILIGTGTGSFSVAVNYTVGTSPSGVSSADFNMDGRIDLVVTNGSSNNISILLGNGTGIFGTPTNYAVGTGPVSVTSADFNMDGMKDLAVVNSLSNNISILLCTSPGNFGTATNYTVGTHPTSVTSGDYNGDGHPDLAVSIYNNNNVSILMGTGGAGTFGTPHNFAVHTNPNSLISADFNNDGNLDLATANKASKDVSVLLSTTPPTINISGSGSVCFGSSTTFTASGALTYTWNPSTIPATGSVVTATPTVATVYTVTGTDVNTCINTATSILNVNMLPNVTISPPSRTICIGDLISLSLTASGANTYTWNTSQTSSTIMIMPTPTVTTNYTVTGTGSNSCTNTATATITVNPLPSVTASSTTICVGQQIATLTANGAVTYTWSPSATLSSGTGSPVTGTPITTTIYTVTGTDGNGCKNTATSTVTVNPLPVVTVNSPTICTGITTTLTASGTATTYSWSTTATTAAISVNPTVTTIYTVTGTDANACTNIATSTVTTSANPAPTICMVTTDTSFTNNVVYWDKTAYANADSFIVYRYDVSSSGYLKLGSVFKDSSQFTDIKRNIGGPNGGDPNITAWQYKLAVKDNCGNISAMSPYHQTVNVQQNNQNIAWNAYVVESGQTNPVSGYQVLRDSLGIGGWRVFVNTSGLSTNDPNYSLYPNANYRIDALGFSCNPTLRLANGNNNTDAAKIKSHSNQNNNRTTGIRQLTVNSEQVLIYPNPANTIINLTINQFDNAKTNSVEVYNTIGECVHRQTIISSNSQIDVSNLAEGIYNLSIISNEGTVNKRVVIVR